MLNELGCFEGLRSAETCTVEAEHGDISSHCRRVVRNDGTRVLIRARRLVKKFDLEVRSGEAN